MNGSAGQGTEVRCQGKKQAQSNKGTEAGVNDSIRNTTYASRLPTGLHAVGMQEGLSSSNGVN